MVLRHYGGKISYFNGLNILLLHRAAHVRVDQAYVYNLMLIVWQLS